MKTNTLNRLIFLVPALVILALASCSGKGAKDTQNNQDSTMTTVSAASPDTASAKVHFQTTLGDFTVLLYGDTPKHRDNFLRLVRENYYDSVLFHRVIKDFMVQTGDPDSRNAAPNAMLGEGSPDYTIEAEIVYPKLFHKRGALAAARTGDQVNPEKRSSGSQFYVVTGKVFSEPELNQFQASLRNSVMQEQFNRLATERRDQIAAMQQAGDIEGLRALQNELIEMAGQYADAHPRAMTDEIRNAYATVGGTPHLDGGYTVFGEVIDGMDTIDRIQNVETNAADRPRTDVRILKAEVVE